MYGAVTEGVTYSCVKKMSLTVCLPVPYLQVAYWHNKQYHFNEFDFHEYGEKLQTWPLQGRPRGAL